MVINRLKRKSKALNGHEQLKARQCYDNLPHFQMIKYKQGKQVWVKKTNRERELICDKIQILNHQRSKLITNDYTKSSTA